MTGGPAWVDVPGLRCTAAGCGASLQVPVPWGATPSETTTFLASDPACQRAISERAPAWVCRSCIRALTEVLIAVVHRAREAA